MTELNTNTAQTIITALSGGTVPLEYAHTYSIGREEQMMVVCNEITEGRNRLRFINGDYGSGKTHFLAMIRHWCIENNFVPSHVVLSPRGAPLHDLTAVYSRIVKKFFLNDNHVSPIESAFEYIFCAFQVWLKDYLTKELQPRCQKYLLEPLYCEHCNNNGDIEEKYIKNFRFLDPRFQIAVILYRWARWGHNPDFDTADLVIRWLEGQTLYRQELNYLGLWDNLGTGDIIKGLNEIAKLFSLFKKRGIVIMLDEAEGIEKLAQQQRREAYQNLHFLINAVKNNDKVFFLYATTPTFFSDVRQYSSDLAAIIESTSQTNLNSLSVTEIKDLLTKITEIYLVSSDASLNEVQKKLLDQNLRKFYNDYQVQGTMSVRNIITDVMTHFQQLAEKVSEAM